MSVHPRFLLMFPFCQKPNLQTQEPSEKYLFLLEKKNKQNKTKLQTAPVTAHDVNEVIGTASHCLVPGLDFP